MKNISLSFVGENRIKGWTPPDVELALVEEDKKFFYGWPAHFDTNQRKVSGISKFSKKEWKSK